MNVRAAIAAVAVPLVACTSARLESLPDSAMGRGFRVGMALDLTVDLLVYPCGGWPAHDLCLGESYNYVEHGFLGIDSRASSVTIAAYKNAPATFPRVQLAPTGTRFVVSRIRRQHWFGFDYPYYAIFVRAPSGNLAGKEMEARFNRNPTFPPTVPEWFKIVE